MTEPQTITAEHLRALLDTHDADSVLGLLGGEVHVIAADQGDSDTYRGALEVISRGELVERVGEEPGDDELRREADALTTSTDLLGG